MGDFLILADVMQLNAGANWETDVPLKKLNLRLKVLVLFIALQFGHVYYFCCHNNGVLW